MQEDTRPPVKEEKLHISNDKTFPETSLCVGLGNWDGRCENRVLLVGRRSLGLELVFDPRYEHLLRLLDRL